MFLLIVYRVTDGGGSRKNLLEAQPDMDWDMHKN